MEDRFALHISIVATDVLKRESALSWSCRYHASIRERAAVPTPCDRKFLGQREPDHGSLIPS
jgi:hypothetical protein